MENISYGCWTRNRNCILALHVHARGLGKSTGASPTVFRYVDWLITVPLQIVEFYLILAAVTKVSANLVLETTDCLSRDVGWWLCW